MSNLFGYFIFCIFYLIPLIVLDAELVMNWLVISGLIIIWLLLSIDDIYEYFTNISNCSILSRNVTKTNVEIIRWFIPRLISVILFSITAIILTSVFKNISYRISVLQNYIPVHLNKTNNFIFEG